MGAELAAVGIDIAYAPVLDVNSNPRNPIIGERAFGTNPQTVIGQATAFIDGLLSGGVLPCGKHFPGHGDTDRDSHAELPIATHSRAELDTTELPPFRAAIGAGIPMLAIGLAGVAGGLVWWMMSGSDDTEVAIVPTGPGFALTGRF